MEPAYIFAALMFAISMGTLIFSVVQFKNKASNTYVDKLEKRIKSLEDELEKCECSLVAAQEKNFQLMKEIISMTQASDALAQIKRQTEEIKRLEALLKQNGIHS